MSSARLEQCVRDAAPGEEHTHACPLCFEREACTMPCGLFDHGEGPMVGSPCACSACEVEIGLRCCTLAVCLCGSDP